VTEDGAAGAGDVDAPCDQPLHDFRHGPVDRQVLGLALLLGFHLPCHVDVYPHAGSSFSVARSLLRRDGRSHFLSPAVKNCAAGRLMPPTDLGRRSRLQASSSVNTKNRRELFATLINFSGRRIEEARFEHPKNRSTIFTDRG
jgi:hypothetical protein